MGKQYTDIPQALKLFIEQQRIFFVGTAAADGRVNVSPKAWTHCACSTKTA